MLEALCFVNLDERAPANWRGAGVKGKGAIKYAYGEYPQTLTGGIRIFIAINPSQ